MLYSIVHRLGISADILFYPDMNEQEKETKHLLNKLAACTKEEREIILNTVDCLADQFISRRYDRQEDKSK